MEKTPVHLQNLADKDVSQLLDSAIILETTIREAQNDLRDVKHRLIEKVINEGWMHCLNLNISMLRRQIYRMNH